MLRRCSPMSQVLGLRLEVPGAASSAISGTSRSRSDPRGTLQLRRTLVAAKAGRSWPDPSRQPSEAETQGIWGDAANNAAATAAAASTTTTTTPVSASSTPSQTSSWSSAASSQTKETGVLSGSQRASPVAPEAWKERPSSAGGEWLGKQIAAAESRRKQEAENAATGEAGKKEGDAPGKKVVRMWYDEGYERDEAGNIILTDEQRTAIIEELRRKYAPKFAAAGPLPQPQPQPQSSSGSSLPPPPPPPRPSRPPSVQVIGGGYADSRPGPSPRPTPTRPPSVHVIGGGQADYRPRPTPGRPPSVQVIGGGQADFRSTSPLGASTNSAATPAGPGPSSGGGQRELMPGSPVGASTNLAATPAQGPVVGQDGKPLNELEQLDQKYADRWRNWKPRGGAPPPPPQPPREPFKSVLDTPMYDKDGRPLNELEKLDVAYADRWKNWKPRHGQGDHPDDVPRSQDTGSFAARRQGWQASSPPPPRGTGTWNQNPAPARPTNPSSPPGRQSANPSARTGMYKTWTHEELFGESKIDGPWFGGQQFNNSSPAAAGSVQPAQAQNSGPAVEVQSPSSGTDGPRFGNGGSSSSPFASQPGPQTPSVGGTPPYSTGSPAASASPRSYGSPAFGSPAATSPPFSYGNSPSPATGSPAATSPLPSYGNGNYTATGSPAATSSPPAYGSPEFGSPAATSPLPSYGNSPSPATGSPAATSPLPSYGNGNCTATGSPVATSSPPSYGSPAFGSSAATASVPSYGNSPSQATGSPAATSSMHSYGNSQYPAGPPAYGGAQGGPSFRSAPGPQSTYGGSAPHQKPFNAYWSKSTGSQERIPPSRRGLNATDAPWPKENRDPAPGPMLEPETASTLENAPRFSANQAGESN